MTCNMLSYNHVTATCEAEWKSCVMST